MMSKGISLEHFDAELVVKMEEVDAQTSDDNPFRVALLGDWSGRSNRGVEASGAELANWRPLLIDRDNISDVMAKLGVQLRLPLSAASNSNLVLDFDKLEDFHPDRIFARSELFQALRETRSRLSDQKTFEQAAAEVRQQFDLAEPDSTTSHRDLGPASETPVPNFAAGPLLDQVLEATDTGASRDLRPEAHNISPELRSLVREIVRPYLVPDDTEQKSLIAAVDKAISQQMRAVLHDPDFQAVESAWGALAFLVLNLETRTQLKFYLLDISREELQAALMEDDRIDKTGIYKLLVEATTETFGGEDWAILAGNYVFDFDAQDANLLKRLSSIASAATAPFIAGAAPRVIGCQSLFTTPDPDDWVAPSDAEAEQAWSELRSLPPARYLGLALPRFLLRLPYGRDTEPTEEFSFEEMPEGGNDHDRYLWANPVFAVSYLLAQAYLQSGWSLRPGEVQQIDELPIHVYEQNGESQIKPCAEVLLTMRAAEKIIERGPMPLITLKDTGSIRVGIFQSLAIPATRLAGRWAN
jgi:type VI secretion system protein ImpC